MLDVITVSIYKRNPLYYLISLLRMVHFIILKWLAWKIEWDITLIYTFIEPIRNKWLASRKGLCWVSYETKAISATSGLRYWTPCSIHAHLCILLCGVRANRSSFLVWPCSVNVLFNNCVWMHQLDVSYKVYDLACNYCCYSN